MEISKFDIQKRGPDYTNRGHGEGAEGLGGSGFGQCLQEKFFAIDVFPNH